MTIARKIKYLKLEERGLNGQTLGDVGVRMLLEKHFKWEVWTRIEYFTKNRVLMQSDYPVRNWTGRVI